MDRVDSNLPQKKFIRKKENFICDHCGQTVIGNGYTNHCPKCLWSKHVDINPGDRQASCHGLMEPVGANQTGGKWKIMYRCLGCGHEIQNKISKDDNMEIIIKLLAVA